MQVGWICGAHLRWNDCVERDFKRAGVEGDWRVRAMDRLIGGVDEL